MTREQPLETTATLLDRVRGGDQLARERLFERYLPSLRRWAHGRLPAASRGTSETDDLVQLTLLRASKHLDGFEHQRPGSFFAYLRTILLNALRDEVRRAGHGSMDPMLDEPASPDASLLEQTIGKEAMEAYERALVSLPEVQQEAVILRIELGFSHQEIADAIGSPSPDAARMLVSRALVQLAKTLEEHR